MNSDNRRKDKSNNNRTAKAITAMPIAGIVVAASLMLSGLALISSSYQPAIAQQQNMTGGEEMLLLVQLEEINQR